MQSQLEVGECSGNPDCVQNQLQTLTQDLSDRGATGGLYGVLLMGSDQNNAFASPGLRPQDVDEAKLAAYLYTSGQPDPDLIIRTGGEWRLSNFLLWQAAYAEYYSTATLWPEFGREQYAQALAEYARRQRRFGGL